MTETKFKQTEIGLIPEDWEVKSLSELCDNFTGLTYDPNDVRDFGTLVLRSSNIQNDALAFDNNVYVKMDIPERAMAKKGDVLVCVRNGSKALIGKSAIVTSDGMAFGAFMTVLRANDSINKDFLLFLWRSECIQRQIQESLGATINQITNADINRYIVALPPLAEQEKIAKALSDADALISDLDALIVKKRDIKQGTMQQLLTGKKRLPGFTDEWKEKEIGEVVKIMKGQSLQSKDFVNGTIPVVAGGQSYAGYHNTANHIETCITISASGAYAGYIWLHNYPIFASDCSVMEGNDNVDVYFLYNVLKLNQDVIYKAQTGGAQPHIHPKDIAPLKVLCPSLSEQQAIATILTDMDNEIQALEAKRDKYTAIKQGMMQELLTGKIRLV
jgi:type I restriction enzyme S subunit